MPYFRLFLPFSEYSHKTSCMSTAPKNVQMPVHEVFVHHFPAVAGK